MIPIPTLLPLLIGLVVAFPAITHAQPRIEHISPPVLECGKANRVTFAGENLAGAIDVWCSLPVGSLKARRIESLPDKAVFEIEPARDAPVGVFGVRLATQDGLSNVHLVLLDDLPVQPRKNEESMRVELPVSVWSTFREAEVDLYRITVQAGQQVSFEVVGSRLGKDADPLLTIRDSRRKWIAERDNDPGLYYDCRFSHRFKEAGQYTIEIRDSRFRGSQHHHYVLRMGRFPAGRVAVPAAVRLGRNELQLPEASDPAIPFELKHAPPIGPFFGTLRRASDEGSGWVPLIATDREITFARARDEKRAEAQSLSIEPAVTLAFNLTPLRANPFLAMNALIVTGRMQGTPAKVPGVLCDVLRKPGERQMFLLEMSKGQTIYVRAEAQSLNSPADLEVTLTDHLGREIRRGTETRGEIDLDFTAGNAGIYGLSVRDQLRDGGNAFAYRIALNDKRFAPYLVAEVEGIALPQGNAQPIPITVTRSGTLGPIRLKLLNAPTGVKLVPDEIGEKENAVVCRLTADPATPQGIYSLQVAAESASGVSLVQTRPLIDRQLINVDLIPLALREDQRRLPPSVADRLALQITPAAPFSMELPEAVVTLPRYQHADVPIVATRIPGFDAPIEFTAKGGQLADKSEGRTRVYAEFPESTVKASNVVGSIHSKILSNLGKSLIEVSGTTMYQGRRITLVRTFELNLVPAFSIGTEPAQIALLPGESTKVRLTANRVKSFKGAVNLKLSPMQGIEFPESVTIPQDRTGVEVEIKVPADTSPRRQNLQVHATATVDGFEEESRNGSLAVEVRKLEPKKK